MDLAQLWRHQINKVFPRADTLNTWKSIRLWWQFSKRFVPQGYIFDTNQPTHTYSRPAACWLTKRPSCPSQFYLQRWTCWISVNPAKRRAARTKGVLSPRAATARRKTATGRRRTRQSWSRWKLNRQEKAWGLQRGRRQTQVETDC